MFKTCGFFKAVGWFKNSMPRDFWSFSNLSLVEKFVQKLSRVDNKGAIGATFLLRDHGSAYLKGKIEAGLICRPLSVTSKCKWSPKERPVAPSLPITWFVSTVSPTPASIFERWA